MFFRTIQMKVAEEFSAMNEVFFMQHKMYLLEENERLEEYMGSDPDGRALRVGYLVIALPIKHIGRQSYCPKWKHQGRI